MMNAEAVYTIVQFLAEIMASSDAVSLDTSLWKQFTLPARALHAVASQRSVLAALISDRLYTTPEHDTEMTSACVRLLVTALAAGVTMVLIAMAADHIDPGVGGDTRRRREVRRGHWQPH